jgi:hypothetical protein
MAGSAGSTSQVATLAAPATTFFPWMVVSATGADDLTAAPATSVAKTVDANVSASGGNPYEGVSAYNADENFIDAEDRRDTTVEMADALTSWDDATDAAATKASSVIDSISISTLFSTVISEAIAAAASAISNALSTAQAESANVVSEAGTAARSQSQQALLEVLSGQTAGHAESSTQVDDSGSLALTHSAAISTAASSRIATLIATGDSTTLGFAEQLMQRATQSGASSLTTQLGVTAAAAKGVFTDMSGVAIPDSIVYGAFNIAKNTAAECVSLAESAALSALDESIITSAITAYRTEAVKTHLRAVNQFAGGMSDINAVNSSAFIFGMALLESDFQSDVDKFQSELRLRLYEQARAMFSQMFAQNVAAYMNAYQAQTQSYMQGYSSQVQAVVGVISEFVRSYVSGFAEYLSAYRSENESDRALFKAIADVKTTLGSVFANVQSQAFMQTLDKGVDAVFNNLAERMNTIRGFASQYFDGTVREAVDLRAQRTAFINAGTAQQLRFETTEFEINKAATMLMAEMARIKTVFAVEEQAKNLEYDVRAGVWDLELFQMAGNVVAAANGSVVTNVGKPTHMQSVLGGALAGASVGAPLGAPGMLVGGIAGLIGGDLMH